MPTRPIIGNSATQYYRNKLEFTFSNQRWLSEEEIKTGNACDRRALGFHRPGCFHRVVDLSHCFLQSEPSNTIRNTLSTFAKINNLTFYDPKRHEGLLRNLIIRTTTTGEVMVIVQFGEEDTDGIQQVMTHLQQQFSALTSLQYVVNTKKNDTFYDLPVHVYAGKDSIVERMESLHFKIGPKSFFQTNPTQALLLYQQIRSLSDLQGHEILYDLYTGVGSIALFLARDVHKVIGIDTVSGAIVDAQENAVRNEVNNATFISDQVEKIFDVSFFEQHGIPDVVVTDPPRAGMHRKVIQQLLAVTVPRIIYVSCNPATQARDIALLSERYKLVTVQPVDLFPHTSHVENIALLQFTQ